MLTNWCFITIVVTPSVRKLLTLLIGTYLSENKF